MARKSQRASNRHPHPDLYVVDNDVRAKTEGPQRRKTWSLHDIKRIKPLTETQNDMFQSYFQGSQIVAAGSAGTGKTFLALYLAACDVLKESTEQDHIVIVRSAVPTRDMGFMPGTLEEKTAHYELPYQDTLAELFGRSKTYDDMKEAGIIKFMTTSYIRGLTWDNAIVIVDECQNMTFHEINSIMTRIGHNTRIIFTGDFNQTDLNKKGDVSGMDKFMKTVKRMKEFCVIDFKSSDIVRSELVKAWIMACEE